MPTKPLAALAAALSLVAPSAAQSGTPAGFARVAIGSDAAFPDVARTARSHEFVVLQSWRSDVARALKNANPNVKVLVYKNLSFTACGDVFTRAQYVPQGVRCEAVERDHPGWFLTDSRGSRINSPPYPWLWLMDTGNAEYQRAWTDAVVAEAKRDGWDGVFMDDVNPTLRYALDASRVARYPTDAAWRAATRSMLAAAGPRIQAAGLLAIPNLCCAREFPGVWEEWLPYVSGAMDEMFTKWGEDPATGYVWDWGADGWLAQVNEIRHAEASGKFFIGIAHSAAGDANAARYGLASMLLASEGRSSFALAQDYVGETWFPEYDIAGSLGAARGAMYRVGSAYRREFERGTVVVNPSLAPQSVSLGATYLAADGSATSSVALPPTSAAILRTAATPAPPPLPAEPAPPAPPAPGTTDPISPAPGGTAPPTPAAEPPPSAPAATGPARAKQRRVTLVVSRLAKASHRLGPSAWRRGASVWRVQGVVYAGPGHAWRVAGAARARRCAVTVFVWRGRTWIPLRRACTTRGGYFSVRVVAGRARRPVAVHAIARYGSLIVRSPVLVPRRPA